MKMIRSRKTRMLLFLLFFAWITLWGHVEAKAAYSNRTYALYVNSMSSNSITKKDVAMMREVFGANRLSQYAGVKKFKTFSYNTSKKGSSQKRFRNVIKKAYKGARKNDLAIFFYTGHSLENAKGKSVGLALARRKYYGYRDIARDLARNIKCKKILCVVNSCFSKSFVTKGIKKLPKKDAKRFIVFASSGVKQDSYGLEGLGSQYVLDLYDGLTKTNRGKLGADYDVNGKVTIDELRRYVLESEQECRRWYPSWPIQDPYCYRSKNDIIYEYSDFRFLYTSCSITAGHSGRIPVNKINIPDSSPVVAASSNPSVVTISPDGVISAWKAGTAVVTLQCAGYSSSCNIVVRSPR